MYSCLKGIRPRKEKISVVRFISLILVFCICFVVYYKMGERIGGMPTRKLDYARWGIDQQEE